MTGIADGRTASADVDVFTFYIVQETRKFSINPKILLYQEVSSTGNEFNDSKEETPVLTFGEPLDWSVAMPANASFTTKCAVTLMPYEDYLGIEANFNYELKDVKCYMVKDPQPGTTIDLSKMEPSTRMDFNISYNEGLPFKVLRVIYSIEYSSKIEGQDYPDTHQITSYDINLTELSR